MSRISFACASSAVPADSVSSLAREDHTDRGVAFGDQRNALDGVDEGLLVDDGMNRVFIGIQAVNGREFAVDELGGGHAAGVLEAQQGRVVRIEIDGDVLMLVQRTRHVAQQRATDQSGGADGRILRRPVKLERARRKRSVELMMTLSPGTGRGCR